MLKDFLDCNIILLLGNQRQDCITWQILYLSRISRASFSKGTRTTTGRPSLVFLGMYSTAPLMILRLVMAYRSLIRHPTRLWNTKTSLCFSNAGSKLKSVLYTCFLSSIVMKIGVPYMQGNWWGRSCVSDLMVSTVTEQTDGYNDVILCLLSHRPSESWGVLHQI